MPTPTRQPLLASPLGRFATIGGALLAVLIVAALMGDPVDAGRRTWPRQAILRAIRIVESGDREKVPDGDGGRAIGPYQIHRNYWRDAVDFRPGLGGTYQDCRRREYAEKVVHAYMERWIPAAWKAGIAKVIARTHNGGPRGAERKATLPYWKKVRKLLRSLAEE